MATFTNRATLTYNGVVTDSNIVTGEIVDSITAAKTAVSDSYSAGDTITYVISLVNTGTSAVTGVSITDNLGAYQSGINTLIPLTYVNGSVLYYSNGTLQPTPTVTAADNLVISGITVPANGNAVIVYSAQANSYAPLSEASTITNTAQITGSGIANTVTAAETITVLSEADLSIAKALSPQTVTENSELTYTFTISNYGSKALTSTDNAVITDTFDPVLKNITVTLNGTVLAENTGYTYNETTGEFATTAGLVTVPAATYTQSVTGEWTVEPATAVLRITGTI